MDDCLGILRVVLLGKSCWLNDQQPKSHFWNCPCTKFQSNSTCLEAGCSPHTVFSSRSVGDDCAKRLARAYSKTL